MAINSKQLQVNVEIDKQLSEEIYTDPLRLKQVLMNLLSNSVKYTKKG